MKGIKTIFKTVIIPASAGNFGKPIGDGKCLGVIIKNNAYILNGAALTNIPASERFLYVGDMSGQFWQLVSNSSTDLILCEDLSEIYVRSPSTNARVQLQIFIEDENE